tara:strand:+ start:3911 stop:5806 length:1896 start_codon:yes stop_codon:yes gene_type:complete
MSVDSLRIEDIYKGTEADIVDHFSNKNKSIAQLQAVVGTLAMSTDTNRLMMFTGPHTGNASRGDFSWNGFSTERQYTLDDSVVGQYNPYVWFAADHVSDQYLGGGDGELRTPVRNEHLGDGPTVRNLKLAAAENNGNEIDYGGYHWNVCFQGPWNGSAGAFRNHPGIVVDPSKFFRMSNEAYVWMGVGSGQDHVKSNAIGGECYKQSASVLEKQADRGSDWGSHAIPIDNGSYKYDTGILPKIITDNGRKYLRTQNDASQTISAQNGFLVEYSHETTIPKVIFQVIRTIPGSVPHSVPMAPKAVFHSNSGFMTRSSTKASQFSFGAYPTNSTQTYSLWSNWYGPGGLNDSTSGLLIYDIDNPTTALGNIASSYQPGWGYYQARRAQVMDTSSGGGANVGTLTKTFTEMSNEVNASGFTNLQGNILHIDNTVATGGVPDTIFLGGNTYGGWGANGGNIYSSKHLPLGHQSCYIPRLGQPQMRVYGAGSYNAAFSDERLNGFSNRGFRTDINGWLCSTGMSPLENFQRQTQYTPVNMYDTTIAGGHTFQMGALGGKNYSDNAGIYGQTAYNPNGSYGTSTYRTAQNHELDIAEIIIVPAPATASAYKSMVDNIEGYLAAKYGIGADCSGSVIV